MLQNELYFLACIIKWSAYVPGVRFQCQNEVILFVTKHVRRLKHVFLHPALQRLTSKHCHRDETVALVLVVLCVFSEFCLFEFNAALHRCLQLGKKRLIVLMMLDEPEVLVELAVTGCECDSSRAALRQYLRQYTYIDYRAADWLDRLSYALPINSMLDNCDEDKKNYVFVNLKCEDGELIPLLD